MRILFIGLDYHQYTRAISAQLNALGHDVTYHDIFARTLYHKSLRLAPALQRAAYDRYHRDIVLGERGTPYDMVLFLQCHQVSDENLQLARDLFPNARFVLYNWDSVRTHDYISKLRFFDTAFTFDRQDAIDFKIEYLPLFGLTKFQDAPLRPDGEGSIYFVGNIVNPDRYLAQLRAVRNGILDSSDTFIGHVPDFDILPIPRREMSPKILRQLIRAIRTQQSIQVEYQSMNDLRPEPIWRTISPHAIGSDGMRWHVRAFCHLQEKYKDFIISRCLGTGAFGERSPNAGEDLEWRDHFDVVLKPNEAFSEAQKRTIELDYGMVDGRCVVPVRLALLYYFNKRMRLDVAERTDEPKERPIVVDNREAYDKVLARLTG